MINYNKIKGIKIMLLNDFKKWLEIVKNNENDDIYNFDLLFFIEPNEIPNKEIEALFFDIIDIYKKDEKLFNQKRYDCNLAGYFLKSNFDKNFVIKFLNQYDQKIILGDKDYHFKEMTIKNVEDFLPLQKYFHENSNPFINIFDISQEEMDSVEAFKILINNSNINTMVPIKKKEIEYVSFINKLIYLSQQNGGMNTNSLFLEYILQKKDMKLDYYIDIYDNKNNLISKNEHPLSVFSTVHGRNKIISNNEIFKKLLDMSDSIPSNIIFKLMYEKRNMMLKHPNINKKEVLKLLISPECLSANKALIDILFRESPKEYFEDQSQGWFETKALLFKIKKEEAVELLKESINNYMPRVKNNDSDEMLEELITLHINFEKEILNDSVSSKNHFNSESKKRL